MKQKVIVPNQKIDDTEIKQEEAHLNCNENLHGDNNDQNNSNSKFDQYSNYKQSTDNSNGITNSRDQISPTEKKPTSEVKKQQKLKGNQNKNLKDLKQSQSNKESNIDISLFSIIDNIEHGCFGNVYLVVNKQTNKQYAAKVSKRKIDLRKSDFYKEISFYSKIESPSILKLHGYSSHDFCGDSKPTMILDYMKNGTLADFLKKSKKSSKFIQLFKTKKFIILMGITLGMNVLHSKGIIHRDLKPENILLDENYYPKICDFGISIISDKELLQHQKSKVGTPYYLAPEIALYEAPYSYKVDVYAFSLIAYELITGKEPFPENKGFDSRSKIWGAIEKGYRPDLSIIPDPEISSLIRRCWARDPTERPSFIEIFNALNKSKYRFGVDNMELINYFSFFNEEANYAIFSSKNIKEQADNGNITAMLNYAGKLLTGQGCPQDNEKALYYMKKASDLGSDYGTYMYASQLLDSINIFDKREANNLLKKLADKGFERAILDYGANLVHGRGCRKDFEEAIKYFKMAADNQNAEALFDYATMLYRGRGIEINKKVASEYYQLSADLGNRNAMYEFARMSFIGDGIEPNISNAKKYFKMAAFQNDAGAMMYLALMYIDGSFKFNPNISKYWFLKCGKLRNNIIFCNLINSVFKKDENGEYNLYSINQFKDYINSVNNADSIYDFNSTILQGVSCFFGNSNDNNNNTYANISISNQSKSTDVQHVNKNRLINQIKVKSYSSFIYDSEKYWHFIDNNLIPKEIKKQIDDYANSLNDMKIMQNVCQHDDPNSIRTYYVFTSIFTKFYFQLYVIQLMQKNNYNLFKPSQYSMHFDEHLIPQKDLNVFIKYLENSPLITSILRNVFDGGKVATYLDVPVQHQNYLKKLMKDFLLMKNLIFDTTLYPLENDIIIKENMIFDKSEDFEVIVDEIKSIKDDGPIIPINIKRNALYFYNDHCINNLFQVSSFLCFKNKVDKMIALNHINEIVYKGKENVLSCNLYLHYATIDDTVYPTRIRKLIQKIFQNIKGVVEFQPYVLSIESPVERTYIGFDSMENLRNGYLRFQHILNILLNHPNPKLFWKKDDLVYLAVTKKDCSFHIIDIKNIIYDLISDFQIDCTERYENSLISVSFLGFKSLNELTEAENRIKKDHNIHNKIELQQYDENSTFITETCNYKERYLFYNSF